MSDDTAVTRSAEKTASAGTLYYIHDPMCSWCWAFRPALTSLLELLPSSIRFERLLGGLAADSDQPMPASMQHLLQQTWKRIESSVPGTVFNHDFWLANQPRRSTWPACRAVIAARRQNPAWELPMIEAIQEAYYLHARNPADTQTLIGLAAQIGCDTIDFAECLHGDAARATLDAERRTAADLGIRGFPSLVHVRADQKPAALAINYHDADSMLRQMGQNQTVRHSPASQSMREPRPD